MTDTPKADTSAAAVERAICNPIISMVADGRSPSLGACRELIDTARALATERDDLQGEVSALYQQAAQYTYIGKDGKAVLAKDLEAERDTLRAALQEVHDDLLMRAPVSQLGKKVPIGASCWIQLCAALKPNGGE